MGHIQDYRLIIGLLEMVCPSEMNVFHPIYSCHTYEFLSSIIK